MTLLPRVTSLATLLALAPAVAAQALIIDFNPDVEDSEPDGLFYMEGGPIFTAETPDEGRELWRTMGTPGDASLVLDLEPGVVGSDPRNFVRVPDGSFDAVFVATTSAEGAELWRTDASATGTALLADLFPGPLSSTPSSFVSRGTQLFFFADDGTNGRELWSTDGTAVGTALVADVRPGPLGAIDDGSWMAPLGTDEVLFTGRFPDGWQLWRSDGTAAGTTFVTLLTSDPTTPPNRPASRGDQVAFFNWTPAEGQEPWTSDGSAAGTTLLADVRPGPEGSGVGMCVAIGDRFYLGLDDGTIVGHELWSSDGTTGGTVLLGDLAPPSPPPPIGTGEKRDGDPIFVGRMSGDLIFSSTSSTVVRPLYRTDGTPGGTTQITTTSSPEANARPGFVWNDQLYYYATDGTNFGTFRTDGVSSQEFIAPVRPTSFGTANLGLVVTGTGIPLDTEIWFLDGRPGNATPYPPLTNPPVTGSSEFEILGSFRERCVFASADFTASFLTFSVQAFANSLEILAYIENPTGFTQNPNFAFFFAETVGQKRPYITLGYRLDQLFELDLPDPDGGETVPFGEQVAFVARGASGRELYVTDFPGDPGFRLVKDLVAGPADSDPRNLAVLNGSLYFTSTSASRLEEEVWISDGTDAGTTMLASGPIRQGVETKFVGVNGLVYFAFRDAADGQELWSTDGTPAGTGPVVDLNSGPGGSYPEELTQVADRLVFLADDGGSKKLWSTDATGTTAILDLGAGLLSDVGSIPGAGVLFFRDVGGTAELWTSDGLTAESLRPLAPPPVPGEPNWTALGSSTLTFAADDGVTGPELWRSDGTTLGTWQLFDLGPTDVAPSQTTRLGNQVLFRGNDGVVGTELFSFDMALVADYVLQAYGYGCAASFERIPEIGVEGEPRVGTGSFELTLKNAGANRPAFLLVGEGVGELEALPGCVLWPAAPLLLFPTMTDAAGEASLTVPTSVTLLDRVFLAQWIVSDPIDGTLGVGTASRGLEVIVGP